MTGIVLQNISNFETTGYISLFLWISIVNIKQFEIKSLEMYTKIFVDIWDPNTEIFLLMFLVIICFTKRGHDDPLQAKYGF